MLTATSDSGRNVFIRHLVLDGSSQWVIGKNVTQKSNRLHIGKNALQFIVDGVADHISMTNREFLSYISLTAFAPGYDPSSVLACLNSNIIKNKSWPELKAIVDKVHRHVCGHANFTDLR